MAPSADRIWLLAQELRDVIRLGYAAAGVDLPERQFVSPGLPAWDCEILAIQLERTFGIAGNLAAEIVEPQLPQAAHAMRGATFAVWLVRCVPTIHDDGTNIHVPSVTEEEAAAKIIYSDVQLLLNVIVAAQRAGNLPGCSGLAFEAWQGVGPQGGLSGGYLRLRLLVGA